ncbi:hypothetical protein BFT35_03280 [Thermoanaerobacterium thermosaccharolyticum]|uniref:Uncharacterized protein n=2 Tax=Thermoanaerobacterium thermosaccharolyticum TaxID=1517 RepID=L0IP79_THETR|nr:hypothetical protein [Thermoanaerobacterium thermosaccharolyticum]AGB20031.1 hypothetical protein Thethe_02463 [Thermoanaerobacterium thermosaccharolyticum M0795]PHO08084.1 hypothetical protein BFT35_03280 [Thermoanaerobacterium thermosaccharolyticum]TCW32039.1 hypothetical protein EDC21_13010 [Thermohydrogenium kirishiense]
MKDINDLLKGLIFKMSDIEEIKKLMDRLSESERDKENASKKMQEVLCKSIREIKDILLSLKKYIANENVTLRSYSGKTFAAGEGIVIFDRSIDEKIVLKPDNAFYLLKVENDQLVTVQIDDLDIHDYMSYDTLFDSVKKSLIKCIQKNEEDILAYRSTMLKIDKYNKDLEEILSLKKATDEKNGGDKNKIN